MTGRLGRSPRFSINGSDVLWAAAAGFLSLATGVAAGVAPVMLAGLFATVALTAAFVSRPVAVLFAILLVRASLDRNDSFLNLGVATFAGAVGSLVFISGALALAISAPRLPARTGSLALVGSLALSLASVTWSLDSAEGLRTWLHLGAVAVIFLVAAQAVRTPARLRLLVLVVLISAVVPVITGLYQLATGTTYTRQGFSAIVGTFNHSNGFAFYLMIVTTLAIVLLFEARRMAERAFAAALLLGATVCFVVTYTRSAWLAIVVILALVGFLQYRQLLVVATIALVAGAAAVPSSLGLVEARFADLSAESSGYSDNSWAWRTENWSRMFHFATERPIQGWGISSYPVLAVQEFGSSNPRFSPRRGEAAGVYAHNDYLRLAVEVGIPGLLLWLAFLVSLCAAMWRGTRIAAIRPYAVALFSLMVAVIAISAVDNMQDYTAVMYYLVALCGGVVGVSRAAG